ncbi:Na(+)-translocating NADH-quinone reductase subunit F [Antarcticibacterium sp. 1MA-6-2]|uniref:Na(+)-translocating NADH-quinone reductase subunit F n=1 Tax=Antarcticibacterium sp. 1MA-6-2 TaxID=2908210 RepID=UPI001F183A3B|nr:Na(+)-translocating NADH-quinone reductase subunit F [Antarcticibacterium sp. 1MA-6-2]UJH91078.1 Na(+)-translocating NADH-quinone reductase subunit F [Antarcticibacterium sp. 1MA-6-2]
MKTELTQQELHNLAMNIVGQDLEENGYEFLGVNSEFKTNPQFVALKEKKLHFVVVRAITYPDNPKNFDLALMKKVKDHAVKFNARTFYAGVGLANSQDYEKLMVKEEDYIINYDGLQEIE